MGEKRLYRVDLEYSFYAMAESESEAMEHLSQALRDSPPDDEDAWAAVVRAGNPIANGWDMECLVYGTDDDLTLGEAIDAMKAKP